MKAIWNGKIVAEADKKDLIYIEGHWYFPPERIESRFFRKSDTPYTCYWKGTCQYFDIGEGSAWSKDNAWTYPELMDSAIKIVRKDFSNYVAFWRDIQVIE